MTCGVEACPKDGTEEVDMDGRRLCARHARAWDRDTRRREGRLYELQRGDVNADMDAVWAEHFSEWCGAQR